MATTCEICKKKIAFWDIDYKTQGMSMHYQCREEFLREPEDDAEKQKKRAEPKEEKQAEPKEEKQAGPWTIAKSITTGKADEHPIREPEGPKYFYELTEKEQEDLEAKQAKWLPSGVSELLSMQRELAALPEIQKIPTDIETDPEASGFASKAGYALSLGLKEKEIFFFGGMQWLAVALAYLLWTQMLFWIPPEVWELTKLTILYLNNNQLTGTSLLPVLEKHTVLCPKLYVATGSRLQD